jgi:hypothetical protein
MLSRLRRIASPAGAFWLVAVALVVAMGCGGTSPFLAMQFATTLQNVGGRGPTTQPSTSPAPGVGTAISSVCDLPATSRVLSVVIANEAQQFVRFSMTYLVSAGPGGFVCDAELQNYVNAGYIDLIPPGGGTTVTVGCDTVQLLSGTRLLGLEFGIDQGPAATIPQNVGGDPGGQLPTFQLTRRDNNSPFVPLPELIVFGNEDPNFICTGSNLCSQRGFLYASSGGITIAAVDGRKIQGTVCNKGFGTAPEWRLDKTPFDNTIQSFQFPVGGTISANVLDRATDSPSTNRNQVVWQVADANGTIVIFPER